MKLPRRFQLMLIAPILAGVAPADVADPNPNLSAPPARTPTDFKALDGDGDGRLSLAEFTAPAVVRRAERQTQAPQPRNSPDVSASTDGILSTADSIEGRYSPEVFKNLDVDHDGFLSPAELSVLFDSGHKISQP